MPCTPASAGIIGLGAPTAAMARPDPWANPPPPRWAEEDMPPKLPAESGAWGPANENMGLDGALPPAPGGLKPYPPGREWLLPESPPACPAMVDASGRAVLFPRENVRVPSAFVTYPDPSG